jgi:hypothetical protein
VPAQGEPGHVGPQGSGGAAFAFRRLEGSVRVDDPIEPTSEASPRPGQHLVGRVPRVRRQAADPAPGGLL